MVNLLPFQNLVMEQTGLKLKHTKIFLIKSLQTIVYDQDEDIDVFVMGDESPSNGIDLSPNSVLRVYETGEVNILENIVDIDFIKQATASLNDQFMLIMILTLMVVIFLFLLKTLAIIRLAFLS